MPFAARLLPTLAEVRAARPADARGDDRRQLRIEAEGSAPAAGGIQITVHDLSISGFRAEGYLDVAEGTIVEIDLPGVGVRSAQVMWAGGRYAGCAFSQPLPLELVAQVMRAAPVVWGRFAAPRPDAPPFEDMRRAADVELAVVDTAPTIDEEAPLRPRTRAAAIVGLSVLLWSAVGAAIWALLG